MPAAPPSRRRARLSVDDNGSPSHTDKVLSFFGSARSDGLVEFQTGEVARFPPLLQHLDPSVHIAHTAAPGTAPGVRRAGVALEVLAGRACRLPSPRTASTYLFTMVSTYCVLSFLSNIEDPDAMLVEEFDGPSYVFGRLQLIRVKLTVMTDCWPGEGMMNMFGKPRRHQPVKCGGSFGPCFGDGGAVPSNDFVRRPTRETESPRPRSRWRRREGRTRTLGRCRRAPDSVTRSIPAGQLTTVTFGRLKVGKYSSRKQGRLHMIAVVGLQDSAISGSVTVSSIRRAMLLHDGEVLFLGLVA